MEPYVSPYPKPTEFEAELLDVLAEEAAEVIHACSKAKRFGFDDADPKDPNAGTNRRKIAEEFGQLVAVINLLTEYNILRNDEINAGRKEKGEKLSRFLQSHPSEEDKALKDLIEWISERHEFGPSTDHSRSVRKKFYKTISFRYDPKYLDLDAAISNWRSIFEKSVEKGSKIYWRLPPKIEKIDGLNLIRARLDADFNKSMKPE